MIKPRIAIACDHRGLQMKNALIDFLRKKNFEVVNCGTDTGESCDYPDFIFQAAEKVAKKECHRAIGICYTGIGSAIAANKVCGVRAALAQNIEQARLSRAHNDSNMLILGAGFLPQDILFPLVDSWLNTPFDRGRHEIRVKKIKTYEQGRH
ncbi:MAG: putative sugar phosphate isomerase YwlF [Candidatus Omnitrophica bacterium ADurb.Bin292]|jgi:ribose 5-phosphate isomerase B|nr:MAG: putative sugar phosphate isomerase YwlF [Candidatus Omnitrophica bacterium ADurb.Bin292]HOG24373.1 RpiB/LacA/LacB family sugar-phosphate isomerase [Candidatus Omnitrophota bacterium]HPW77442.1 RpiB/LacA/LacB family sugar-phosphate isomerase [Candidatus Omnitrophota bacterium]HQB11677.1 RpiB/LacA/LacB family sugar-phosphate isomerase [Candidatus Omnitrophota bacterium]